jgi:hypothetical protein
MPLELLTLKDLQEFKVQLFEELRKILAANELQDKNLLKSKDVCNLLKISPGTLQNFRNNQTIIYTKLGGTLYYDYDHIKHLIKKKKG